MSPRTVRVAYGEEDWARGSVFHRGLRPGMGDIKDYIAMNFQRYKDGTLGPRPALVPQNYSGMNDGVDDLDVGDAVWVQPDTDINSPSGGRGRFFLASYDYPSRTYLGLYRFEQPTGWVQLFDNLRIDNVDRDSRLVQGGIIDAPASIVWVTTDPKHVYVGGDQYFDSTMTAPVTPGSITAISNVGTGKRGCVLFKERVYFWGSDSASDSQRIWYTDAGSFSTVSSASQFFDVSAKGAILACYATNDALLIVTKDGEWYAYSGGDPSTATLRQIGKSRRPIHANAACVYGDRVIFWAELGGFGVATPNGVEIQELDWLRPPGDADILINPGRPRRLMAFPDSPAIIAVYEGPNGFNKLSSIDYVNGAWNWSAYFTEESGLGSESLATNDASFDLIAVNSIGVNDDAPEEFFVIAKYFKSNFPDPADIYPVIYRRPIYTGYPSREYNEFNPKQTVEFVWRDGQIVKPADHRQDFSCELNFRPFQAENGYEVRVKQVIVDVLYWWDEHASGGGNIHWGEPTAGLRIELPDEFDGTGRSAVTMDLDDAHHSVKTEGSARRPARIVWNPPPLPWAEWQQVRLVKFKNLAIRSVVIEYEIRETPR